MLPRLSRAPIRHARAASCPRVPSRPLSTGPVPSERLSVAPMVGVTDRHMRYFLRLLSARTVLYTEMVTDWDIAQSAKAETEPASVPKPTGGKRPPLPLRDILNKKVGHHPSEHPLVLQLGGCSPESLAISTRSIANSDHRFFAFNLNCGCPAPSAGAGRYGAVLMLKPTLVRDICAAMKANTDRPVSVKCRIGVDERESYPELRAFIATVAEAGVDHFIVHARKCFLQGLSAHENRTVPPLRYEVVHDLIRDFPSLRFTLNGGVSSLAEARAHLESGVHGVMMGRSISSNPLQLLLADHIVFGEPLTNGPAIASGWTRRQLITHFALYADTVAISNSMVAAVRPKGSERVPAQAALPDRFKRQRAKARPETHEGAASPVQTTSVFTMLRPLQNILHGLPHQKTFAARLSENCFRYREAVQTGEMLPSQLIDKLLDDIDSERDGSAVGTGVTLKWMLDVPLLDSLSLTPQGRVAISDGPGNHQVSVAM